ncbi:MAG: hypothetical protein NT023_16205 [Armatimonadetes bacterium]|nr:hypothetical protein [Armatimonadota bacterium]
MNSETITAQELDMRGCLRCEECDRLLAQWSSPDRARRTLQLREGLQQVALWTKPDTAVRGKCRCGVLYTIYLP